MIVILVQKRRRRDGAAGVIRRRRRASWWVCRLSCHRVLPKNRKNSIYVCSFICCVAAADIVCIKDIWWLRIHVWFWYFLFELYYQQGWRLGSINVVTLRWAQLFPGWINYLGMYVTSHPGQLSLANGHPSVGRHNECQLRLVKWPLSLASHWPCITDNIGFYPFVLQCYGTVGWVIWRVKSSPEWPILYNFIHLRIKIK